MASPVVCVFCGASPGNSPATLQAARDLARAFAENNIQLVYGGGTVGIMGELAQALVSLRGPGAVHGIIPRSLLRTERKGWLNGADDGNSHDEVDDASVAGLIDESKFGRTTVVPDMHTRKQMMKEAVVGGGPGSGFVALTGGYGTLEELMEMVTWNQLGIHAMPVVLFNVDGYWDGILEWVRTAVARGFISASNATIMAEAATSEEVLERLRTYVNSEGRFKLKWEAK